MLQVRHRRVRIRPGMEAEADRWMRMLNERLPEALETLERERVALEMVFRERTDEGEFLIWVMIQGQDGAGIEDSPFPIDHEHLAFGERVKEPPETEAELQLLLLPAPVREALTRWAAGGGEAVDDVP